MDIPRLRALTDYWSANPPLHLVVAAALGAGGKPSSSDIHAASEFVPVATIKADEFDAILKEHGIPP